MISETRPTADRTAVAPAQSTGISRRRILLVVAPLIFMQVIIWAGVFGGTSLVKHGPNGKGFGADFSMFITGARILERGGNPYDHNVLVRTERAYLTHIGLPVTAKSLEPIVRVGNPPFFFWALQPLTRFPFQPTALAWILAMWALSAIGFLGALRFMGWRHWATPLVIFLLMPQVIFGAYYGNVIGLVWAAIGLALALLRRYPTVAGLLLGLAWLKPQVALAAVLLLILFQPEQRARLVAGFAAATIFLFGLGVITTGWISFEHWLGGLFGYSRDITIQRDISSLAGLYIRHASPSLRLVLEGLSAIAACVLTAWWWWKLRDRRVVPFVAVAWLWLVWFLATPYAHFADEMVLSAPLLALVGRDGSRLNRPAPIAILYLMFFSLALVARFPFRLELFSLPLLAVLAAGVALAATWRTTQPHTSPDPL